eukprot:TRINITY_DN3133_c0_g1_i1.p1 TRINITY_DN3133_c0_g1~~TRINITY_DN3133_c0_g1_i1.p1  ORF type:complete len:273 (-),score=44.84 TRINITY_DN3133_c0_g1_i1:94-912(-)
MCIRDRVSTQSTWGVILRFQMTSRFGNERNIDYRSGGTPYDNFPRSGPYAGGAVRPPSGTQGREYGGQMRDFGGQGGNGFQGNFGPQGREYGAPPSYGTQFREYGYDRGAGFGQGPSRSPQRPSKSPQRPFYPREAGFGRGPGTTTSPQRMMGGSPQKDRSPMRGPCNQEFRGTGATSRGYEPVGRSYDTSRPFDDRRQGPEVSFGPANPDFRGRGFRQEFPPSPPRRANSREAIPRSNLVTLDQPVPHTPRNDKNMPVKPPFTQGGFGSRN